MTLHAELADRITQLASDANPQPWPHPNGAEVAAAVWQAKDNIAIASFSEQPVELYHNREPFLHIHSETNGFYPVLIRWMIAFFGFENTLSAMQPAPDTIVHADFLKIVFEVANEHEEQAYLLTLLPLLKQHSADTLTEVAVAALSHAYSPQKTRADTYYISLQNILLPLCLTHSGGFLRTESRILLLEHLKDMAHNSASDAEHFTECLSLLRTHRHRGLEYEIGELLPESTVDYVYDVYETSPSQMIMNNATPVAIEHSRALFFTTLHPDCPPVRSNQLSYDILLVLFGIPTLTNVIQFDARHAPYFSAFAEAYLSNSGDNVSYTDLLLHPDLQDWQRSAILELIG